MTKSPLRIAVIGSGHWGPNLIRNFHTHGESELAWVVDINDARLGLVRERYPDVRTATDASVAFFDPAVDAVVIATPSSSHFALASAALSAGKHVLIEKPMATCSVDAEALCQLAAATGRVLMVGHVFLFNRAVQAVRDFIDSGRFGQLFYLSMVRTNLGPIRPDVNAAWDLAAHDIAIANYWLRETPLAASAQSGCWINPGVDDAVFATLWYPNSIVVHLHVSWLSPRKVRDITVVGANGMLTFDDMNIAEPLRIYDKVVTEDRTPAFVDTFASFRTSIREGDIVIPRIGIGEPLKSECEHFLECIRSSKEPLSAGDSGLAVIKVLEAMDRSLSNDGRREAV